MSTETPIAQNIYPESVKIVHTLAKKKEKKKRVLTIVNVGFILFEYAVIAGLFLSLFKWRLDGPVTQEYLELFSLILILYTFFSLNQRLLHPRSPYGWVEELIRLSKVIFNTAMTTIAILFLLKVSVVYSRAIIILFFTLLLFLTWAVKGIKRISMRILYEQEKLVRNVLIIGAGKVGKSISDWIREMPHLGYRLVGFLDDTVIGEEVKGGLNDYRQVIIEHEVDEVLISIPSERQFIQGMIQNLRNTPISIKIVPELYDLVTTRIAFEQVQSYPFIEVNKRDMDEWQKTMKRGMDIILSLIGLTILSPIFLITAIAIKLDSPGPVIFKQKRIGKNGVSFYMYKFRSMVTNAEEMKEKLAKQNEADGPVFKIKNDPRITKVGKFIRKYSIDELPQLINVLVGNMSLIGPRPPLPNEVEQYDDFTWRRLEVLPGISGLWQVSGRSNTTFEEWVNLDIYYIENWSLVLDIKILLKTIPVVLMGKGAY